ncbi:MAG: polyprenyl synthetase family protein [Prevotella sp.]|nr:polyprenyl synthetase family protein [Prevotella sp.]
METSFVEYLKEKREWIGGVIDEGLRQFHDEDSQTLTMMGQQDYLDLFEEHWEIVSDYPRRRGKYVRPTLVVLMADAMAGAADKAVYTAAAMQLSEDWILVHDDLEDQSLERRGCEALHRLVGVEVAVNAGDTLHECMHRMQLKNYDLLPLSLARRVQQEFFLMIGRTAFGQYAELKWTRENRDDLSEQDVLFTVSGKTVYYTIAGPLRLGAILAGATEEQLQRIYRFSYPLGLCFQIRDDVLDLTGDFEGQKKQQYNDIYEGKRTLILLHLLSHCTDAERERIEKTLSLPREQKDPDEVAYIRSLMDVYGSIAYAEAEAGRYADEAMRLLPTLDFIKPEYQPLFQSMVQFILQRGR